MKKVIEKNVYRMPSQHFIHNVFQAKKCSRLIYILIFLVICTCSAFTQSRDYFDSLEEFKARFKDYSLSAHEREKTENKQLLENIIKETFSYVPGVEKFLVYNNDQFSSYLEEIENRISSFAGYYLYPGPENKEKIGYSALFGEIVGREEREVELTNPGLAELFGKKMIWRAIYFISENKTLDEHRKELAHHQFLEKRLVPAWVCLNSENKSTAYINVDYYPRDVDAHEMIHIWQVEDDYIYLPKLKEFQALVFDLVYNAYNDRKDPIDRMKAAMRDEISESFYYDAGQYFIEYFGEKGYTAENIHEMPPEERERYGLKLLKVSMKYKNDLFY